MPSHYRVSKEKVAQLEKLLGPRGRVVVRLSGTEPVLRIMAEGSDQDKVHEVVNELAEHVSAELG